MALSEAVKKNIKNFKEAVHAPVSGGRLSVKGIKEKIKTLFSMVADADRETAWLKMSVFLHPDRMRTNTYYTEQEKTEIGQFLNDVKTKKAPPSVSSGNAFRVDVERELRGAILSSDVAELKFLIERFRVTGDSLVLADVYSADPQSRPALQMAVLLRCSFEFITTLLQAGASLETKNRAAQVLGFHTDIRVIQLLIDAGVDIKAQLQQPNDRNLYEAVSRRSVAMVTRFLALGANVETRSFNGVTPLFAAVKAGRLDLVELLLAHRAAVHAVDGEGNTPLFYATKAKNVAMLNVLWQHNRKRPEECLLRAKVQVFSGQSAAQDTPAFYEDPSERLRNGIYK